jgi:hypothetical protein
VAANRFRLSTALRSLSKLPMRRTTRWLVRSSTIASAAVSISSDITLARSMKATGRRLRNASPETGAPMRSRVATRSGLKPRAAPTRRKPSFESGPVIYTSPALLASNSMARSST